MEGGAQRLAVRVRDITHFTLNAGHMDYSTKTSENRDTNHTHKQNGMHTTFSSKGDTPRDAQPPKQMQSFAKLFTFGKEEKRGGKQRKQQTPHRHKDRDKYRHIIT